MTDVHGKLSQTFRNFFDSEKSSGVLLLICTVTSLALANSPVGPAYLGFWHQALAGLSVEVWINDGLMAIFFLLIGLELEREFYNGELANFKTALLPIFAAVGGIVVPALIHFSLNAGTATQAGMGIPMATDIAFALGVLAILGSRVPASLKIFLTALAIIDDLGAIIVIAFFYTSKLFVWYLGGALLVWVILLGLNHLFKVMSMIVYLLGGVVMWWLMFKSGVHPTIAGVLLAVAIPFSPVEGDVQSPSHRLENLLHKPVAFLILPIFALSNTAIIVDGQFTNLLVSANSLGILSGLILGKPIGITLLSFVTVSLGICKLPSGVDWRQIAGAGILGGIGFTMSIFIANLAFAGDSEVINSSKMAILLASLVSGTMGFIWLRSRAI